VSLFLGDKDTHLAHYTETSQLLTCGHYVHGLPSIRAQLPDRSKFRRIDVARINVINIDNRSFMCPVLGRVHTINSSTSRAVESLFSALFCVQWVGNRFVVRMLLIDLGGLGGWFMKDPDAMSFRNAADAPADAVDPVAPIPPAADGAPGENAADEAIVHIPACPADAPRGPA